MLLAKISKDFKNSRISSLSTDTSRPSRSPYRSFKSQQFDVRIHAQGYVIVLPLLVYPYFKLDSDQDQYNIILHSKKNLGKTVWYSIFVNFLNIYCYFNFLLIIIVSVAVFFVLCLENCNWGGLINISYVVSFSSPCHCFRLFGIFFVIVTIYFICVANKTQKYKSSKKLNDLNDFAPFL